jgi:hypothetical protein
MTKILAVSDFESQYIYHAVGGGKFRDIGFVISCGDLPYYYLEYIVSMSNKDMYYVKEITLTKRNTASTTKSRNRRARKICI